MYRQKLPCHIKNIYLHINTNPKKKMKTIHKIALIIAIVVIVASSIIISLRWNAWFGNPTEETYAISAVQDRIVLSYTLDGKSITISWRYGNKSTKNVVEYYDMQSQDTLFVNAQCTTISTQGGTQNHYRATLHSYTNNTSYTYRLINDSTVSDWHAFTIGNPSQAIDFILFGDIQDEADGPSAQLFHDVALHYPKIDFWAFVGDLAERPTDYYWHVVFDALQPYASHIPIIACPGNHEHRKGLKKELDPRWIWMFGQPQLQNATDYSIDMPLLHIASVNSDGFFWPWDYLQKKNQLTKYHILSAPSKQQWNVLLMHHPIYPGSIGRHNLLFRTTLNPLIEKNDIHLVLCGHDHSYARRIAVNEDVKTPPVYLLTNSSSKYYLSNCDPAADKIACGIRLYSHIHITPDTLRISTYTADAHQLYDEIICIRTSENIQVIDMGDKIAEQILLPERFNKDSKKDIRKKFMKKKALRESSK